MSNASKVRIELVRIGRAATHSAHGLASAYSAESAFRREVWLSAVMLPAAFWIGRGWVEIAMLAGSAWLVLVVELLNSGLEATIDRVSLEWHELSKLAKDVGSAAVLMALLLCAGIWIAAIVGRLTD